MVSQGGVFKLFLGVKMTPQNFEMTP